MERTASNQLCRPDVVLFVNGIPLCGHRVQAVGHKELLEQAISQNIRNQGEDYIPKLFMFSQLLVAVTKNEAAYATTGTAATFWSRWRELGDGKPARTSPRKFGALINRPLSRGAKGQAVRRPFRLCAGVF